jgi:hypothetical protein
VTVDHRTVSKQLRAECCIRLGSIGRGNFRGVASFPRSCGG